MARPSYGSEVKNRTKQVLRHLLDFANDQYSSESPQWQYLQTQIQTHWQTDRRLVVRTKIRFLEILTQELGSSLLGDQIRESLKRMEDLLGILQDNRPHRSGSEVWHFTLTLWHNRWEQSQNLATFDLVWEEQRLLQSKKILTGSKSQQLALDPNPAEALSQDKDEPWREWCQMTLKSYQTLTTNPLTSQAGIRLDWQDIYIPLTLSERHHIDRRDQEVLPEMGSQVYAPEEDNSNFVELDTFLASLMLSIPQRIAIVGEPGSGKTTLLQKIGSWLLEQHALPIWIPASDLQDSSLETYLLETWLKQVTYKVIVPTNLQEKLLTKIQKGHIWILLDAIDELGSTMQTELMKLSRQLRIWTNLNILTTCRLNVWDMGKNPLDMFTVYRNLSFSFERKNQHNSKQESQAFNQVHHFIRDWFKKDPLLGDKLYRELDKPDKRRIRDTIKNPLRLALLCRSWSMTQGNLPMTRSLLYSQCIDAIYEWKQDCFPVNPPQKLVLNQFLSELALAAFCHLKKGFRLPYSFIQTFLQNRDLESMDLFMLVLQVGWLNQVGISSVSGEKIYAFYHPTFQEYFAAQAVSDWNFFFSLVQDQTPIFSSYWREVILLWIGRPTISSSEKDAFLQALIQFEDTCGGFYSYRATYLAAAGLAEFPHSCHAEHILARILNWRFGTIPELQRAYPFPIVECARQALLQTDPRLATQALEHWIQTHTNSFALWQAAYTLGRTVDPGNLLAIETLTYLISTIETPLFQMDICESLGKLDPKNSTAILTLIKILETSPTPSLSRKAAYILGKLDPGNVKAQATLETLIQSTLDPQLRKQALDSLLILDPNHALAHSLPPKKKRSHSRRKPTPLNHQQQILALEARLNTSQDPDHLRRSAYRLGLLQPGHTQALNTLLRILPHHPKLEKVIIQNLKDILVQEQWPEVIRQVKIMSTEIMSTKLNPLLEHPEVFKLLWHSTQMLPYHHFCQVWNCV